MTHCNYDIRSILDQGNKRIVNYEFWEGLYENVISADENRQEKTVSQYIRKNLIESGTIVFEYYTVDDNEMYSVLRDLLSQASNLEILD